MIRKTRKIEIRVAHARVTVSDKLRQKAIQMKAKADGMTLDQFRRALSEETRELYRRKLYPTKFGLEKAYRDEGGDWRANDIEHGSLPHTLQNVLDANLYRHTRAYLLGLVLSEMGKRDKNPEAGAIILRNDNKVAIVKQGKPEFRSDEDYFKTPGRGKSRRNRSSNREDTENAGRHKLQ